MLTLAENFAASQVLTEWPDYMTYDELLTAIENDHCDVVIYELYEDRLQDEIIETIECLRSCFLGNVKTMTENLRNAIKKGDPLTIAEKLQQFENQLGE